MLKALTPLTIESIKRPQDAARALQAWDIPREALWTALAAVALMSVIVTKLIVWLTPAGATSQPFPSAPVVLAVLVAGGLVITVLCTYYFGRVFGGTGSFDDSMKAVIWLQWVLLVLQVGQVILFLISPGLALLAGLALFLIGIWIFLNFVLVIHDFNSLAMVFFGTLITIVGVSFGLAIVASLFAALLGLEVQNV
ncbi:YIP1 family protein [Litoreibacter roseus]|uniref:Yip1 domain-containing protein n=1 Tax=Litoreibacter roseus TaxID=2601869 RepID=A0A6N6JMF8_9RHOB|nr:YIP1 family protein [Litoreibacter roseus]GFE66609.1 hypothetical protein KIN_36830 [Litoreibacter roseus]